MMLPNMNWSVLFDYGFGEWAEALHGRVPLLLHCLINHRRLLCHIKWEWQTRLGKKCLTPQLLWKHMLCFQRRNTETHFWVRVLEVFVFLLSTSTWINITILNTTFPPLNSSKLTVFIIGVDRLLPVSIVVPPPLPILESHARLPVESLLF